MIDRSTPFDLVHVGKCGGTSITEELRARDFHFEHVHLRRPVAEPGRRYVVLTRDPVARVVSAFNWRRHLLNEDLLPAAHGDDPIARLRHRAEREFSGAFDHANQLAESLVQRGEYEVSATATLMQLIGHVPQGFAWYLGDLLDRIEPGQLGGVIATERLMDDSEAVFGFRPTLELNRREAPPGSNLSAAGRANLAREFGAEYRILDRLADLACRAGVPSAIRYDPLHGAVPG